MTVVTRPPAIGRGMNTAIKVVRILSLCQEKEKDRDSTCYCTAPTCSEDRLRDLLKPLGLHAGQARFIDALGRIDGATQRQLSGEFNITSASMSQMTKRLVTNGYIHLDPDPKDKRAAVLSLTDKGMQIRGEILAAWEKLDREIVEAIGQEGAEQLFTQSGNLRNVLSGKAPLSKD